MYNKIRETINGSNFPHHLKLVNLTSRAFIYKYIYILTVTYVTVMILNYGAYETTVVLFFFSCACCNAN